MYQLKAQYVQSDEYFELCESKGNFCGIYQSISPVTVIFFLILRSISMWAGLLNLLQKFSWFP